ncbi:heme-binding protein [Candidatus Woesearchaeota archaeon]|nr:heme-binding protein [Candidatus Woesearchaeota archaeon]
MAIATEAIKRLEITGSVASISIVNIHGFEIARLVMDGAKPVSANVALMKAKQAAALGKLTSETRDEIEEGKKTPALLGIQPDCVVPWAGGVPIYDEEGNLLGGLGISNLTEDEDEDAAENAVVSAGFLYEK